MKNFMIFLSLVVVIIFACIDAKERFEELDDVSLKTPAQVEIKQNQFQKPKEKEMNSFNQKQHQNNNLPQNKQDKPLTKK